MRKYPPASNLIRIVTKDYHIPEMDLTLPKGLIVSVPVLGIHHDPEFYPEPEKFLPDRFSPEETAKRPPCTFIPFGEGPRICIGLRFGMLQAKIGLAMILKYYKFTLHPATPVPLQIDPNALIYSTKNDILLKMEKI